MSAERRQPISGGRGEVPEDTLMLITWLTLFAIVAGYVLICISTARHSWRKYGYRLYLNWNNLWYLAYVPLYFVALVSLQDPKSASFKLLLMMTFLIPVSIAGLKNIRKTSLLFGIWATLIQATSVLSIALIYMFWDNGRREAEKRKLGINP